jgi:PBP1b-binding outer membrane lipoprotein LpoB
MPKKLLIIPLICLLLVGCSNDLQTIANAENAIPQAVVLIANTSTQLVTQGSMTAAEGAKVASILTDIVNANAHAVTATKAITSLNSTTKPTIAAIVTPIIQEVQAAVTSGDVYAIKNASAKLTITTALTALVTTLQIIQAKVS